ncbi:hypothetical protein L21SP3_01156 [Sedimentisphaera cyanobacteriorum]|uniref:Putative nickel insertion protein n=1 Tax=Sedimentisphaera cyanobacteriorum TaxID=1940790 RepID=A0A1Q2HPG3_9BACT|nr:nickel pincer cofactor biosynthesis protein LarC [Sedimentisphaera cyanobacteriorum]AQQ09352.1 hypothetical protein L21SP3_01156 [Sedimentisphaera cyanobacteriorum]
MKIGIFDCPSGAAGDMILGSLIDCGADSEKIKSALMSLGIEELEGFSITEVIRSGVRAVKFAPVIHHHHQSSPNEGHHHQHRHLPDIERMIDAADLPEKVQQDSKAVFSMLAKAEAQVHGTTPEKVHFHEVGAADSIADIVGCCLGIYLLEFEKIYCPKVAVGSGTVECAHGVMPVPAPATEILIRGLNVFRGEADTELLTPTGASILKYFCLPGEPPAYTNIRSGYGAGSKEFPKMANIIRLTEGSSGDEQMMEKAVMMETNVDDSTGELVGSLTGELAGKESCLDVWTEPIYMKKGRPGVKFCVLCKEDDLDRIAEIIFQSGITLGIRYHKLDRITLQREFETVEIEGCEVNLKKGFYNGKQVFCKPEFSDCRKLAEMKDVSPATALNTITGPLK